MTGLLLKDFTNLKRYVKTFGIFLIIYGFMAFTQKDASFFTSIFTLMFAILTMSTYAFDETAKWDVYALTMPITREDIVRGKYYLMLLLVLLGAAISAVFTIIINIVVGLENIFLGLEACYIGAAVVILFYSITLPIITKLGVEKARIVFFAVYIVPMAIGFVITKAVNAGTVRIPDPVLSLSEWALQYRFVLIPVVLIVVLWISYSFAIQIYRKKEF